MIQTGTEIIFLQTFDKYCSIQPSYFLPGCSCKNRSWSKGFEGKSIRSRAKAQWSQGHL